MSDPANKRLGDYEILDVLGAGGMGRVYKVRNTITDRVEAMKVLLPDLQGHEQVAARFLREIKVLAALKHPNIAGLLTALTIDNQLVMVMEYVEGQSLSSRVDQGAIPVAEALQYLDQVLAALDFAHRQHVIHRDIKPANMMLTQDGAVKLMDFGIARSEAEPRKLTATGTTLGSLSYMSPEQVTGQPTDERSDLYSLGIAFYEMVTGVKPFQGDSDFSIMAAQINQAPTPPVQLQPSLPRSVNDIILKSIAKDPAERFQSAEAFRYAVKRTAQGLRDQGTMVQGSVEIPSGVIPAQRRPEGKTVVQGSSEYTVGGRVQPTSVPTAPAVPTAAAQPAASVPPAPAAAAQPSSHRGLYMGLGALVVVVVLIAAGLYMPKWRKASAADAVDSGQPAQVTTAPSAQPAATEQVKPAEQAQPVEPSQPAAGGAKKMLAGNPGAAPGGQAAVAVPAPDTAELDAIEHEIDQLTSRAAAVSSSLDALQRQQQAEGFGLRGDIASKQVSMKINLAKAQEAIGHNDAARAKRYAGMASADVEALEKFLGR
jgi:serine/threonine protein kinase